MNPIHLLLSHLAAWSELKCLGKSQIRHWAGSLFGWLEHWWGLTKALRMHTLSFPPSENLYIFLTSFPSYQWFHKNHTLCNWYKGISRCHPSFWAIMEPCAMSPWAAYLKTTSLMICVSEQTSSVQAGWQLHRPCAWQDSSGDVTCWILFSSLLLLWAGHNTNYHS